MDIYEKIDTAMVVSFDIFDTLIKRNVQNPEDVFKIIELKYNHLNKNKIKEFKKYRVEAERIARSKCKNEEISLEEIYKVLEDIYPYYNGSLKKIEIECEKNICTVNYDVYKLYKYALEKNKDIYIISDFYLDKNILKEILNNNNITVYKEIFVSCEIGLTKKSGNLFRYIIDKQNINTLKMLHIGDHPISDNETPQQLGIKTYKVYNEHHQLKHRIKKILIKNDLNITENIINTFIQNTLKSKPEDGNCLFGYENLGILYYGFLQKINNLAKELKVEKIYFFSRDGYILKQAYDKTFFCDSKIESSYFYISRRAVVVPALVANYELDKVINLLGIRGKDTVSSFFKRVGLNIEDYNDSLLECSLKPESSFKDCQQVRKLYELIREDIINNATKELEILQKYFIQEGINSIDKCLIVDIGWRGSMQYSLEKILERLYYDVEVYGIYLGLNKESETFLKDGMNAQGFLFSEKNNYYSEIELSAGVGLIESLFLANHGTVLGYKESDNVIEPILGCYEYSEDDTVIINKIQNAAIEFVEDFYKFNKYIDLNITGEVAFKNIKKFIKQPNGYYINVLGDLGFSDYSDGKLAKPKSLLKYFLKPNEFKNEFLVSQWKICFLKRLFKIKLPYFKIYKFLRRNFSN